MDEAGLIDGKTAAVAGVLDSRNRWQADQDRMIYLDGYGRVAPEAKMNFDASLAHASASRANADIQRQILQMTLDDRRTANEVAMQAAYAAQQFTPDEPAPIAPIQGKSFLQMAAESGRSGVGMVLPTVLALFGGVNNKTRRAHNDSYFNSVLDRSRKFRAGLGTDPSGNPVSPLVAGRALQSSQQTREVVMDLLDAYAATYDPSIPVSERSKLRSLLLLEGQHYFVNLDRMYRQLAAPQPQQP